MADLRALRKMVLSDDVYGTTMLLWAIDTLGPEAVMGDDDMVWHPQTIHMELSQALGVSLPKPAFDRLMAAVSILTTDAFYNDVKRFIQICNILSHDEFSPYVFDPADSLECAWGVVEATLIEPSEYGFSEEIIGYMDAVLKEEGFIVPPRVLKPLLPDYVDDVDQSIFSDDPVLFESAYGIQQSRSDEVDNIVMERFAEIDSQIKALPLRNGSLRDWDKQFTKLMRIGATDASSTNLLPGSPTG